MIAPGKRKTPLENQTSTGALQITRNDCTEKIYGADDVTHRALSFLLPALIAAAPSLSSAAPQSLLEAAFGNTIVSTYPDGRKAELYLARDGSYQAKGRRRDPSSGHWKLKGEKLCLSQAKPFAAPFSFCTPLPTAGFGGAWSAKAVTGETISVRLVHGHV
jgi:hypothetical protein